MYRQSNAPLQSMLTTKDEAQVTWLPRLLFGSLSLLFATLAFYAGVKFGYEPLLVRQGDDLRAQIVQLGKVISPQDRADIMNFYAQALDLKVLLAKHTYPSQFFTWLEGMTHKRVTFDSAHVNFEQNTVELLGRAFDMQAITDQAAVFEASPDVSRVVFSNTNSGPDSITFRMTVTFKSSLVATLSQ